MLKHLFILLALLALAPAALATTFVVPTDEEMVTRADAIVIARAERHWVDSSPEIQTVHELRVERTIKGSPRADELLRIVSPGGVLEDRGVLVPGAPKLADGERALLFLTLDHGRWMTTDLALGKFRFTSAMGERLLVRDLDDAITWDRSGAPHRERVRREEGFLLFLEERAAGRRPTASYFTSASALTINSAMEESPVGLEPHTPGFPAYTYTDNVQLNGNYVGIRWENMSGGVTIYKRTETNISGLGDGGASVIQNALASWNNEAASNINLIYGGQLASTPSAYQDGISVVEFNDPQNRIGGTWTGSGVVATAFISFFDPHEWPAGTLWWSIRDFDVVFQDGFPGTHAAFPTAMTHEVGHGIGYRHSNAHYIRSAGGADQACQPASEECSNTAIMYFQAVSALGYTLQTWDQNAAQAVYPAPPCSPPSITSQPGSPSITSGATTNLSVTASGSTPFTYQWYLGTSGNISQPISGATNSSLTVGPTTTTNYWVRVTNACGSADSVTATVTVTGGNTNPGLFLIAPCRFVDTRNPNAPYGGPALSPSTARNFVVVGQCGIPSGATAIAVNVAAVTPPSQGHLRLYPGPISSPLPGVSNLNFRFGETLANNAIVPLGPDGSINAFNVATSSMHAVIDIFGFFR